MLTRDKSVCFRCAGLTQLSLVSSCTALQLGGSAGHVTVTSLVICSIVQISPDMLSDVHTGGQGGG